MKTVVHFALLGAFGLFHTLIYASYEESEVSLPVMFNDAKAVFIGTAIEGTPFNETKHYQELELSLKDKNVSAERQRKIRGEVSSLLVGKVRFTVEQIFKGDLHSNTMVDVGPRPYVMRVDCLLPNIESYQRYIVFADGEENNFQIICGSEKVGANASKEVLDFLQHLPPVGSGGTIQGKIKWWKNDDYQPLANVTVHISGKDQLPVTLKTGPDGAFEIKHLLPGHYRVEPELPRFPGYHVDDEEEVKEVDLDDRGAAEVHFKLSLADESSMESAAPEVP
jgi:hypothetical protein